MPASRREPVRVTPQQLPNSPPGHQRRLPTTSGGSILWNGALTPSWRASWRPAVLHPGGGHGAGGGVLRNERRTSCAHSPRAAWRWLMLRLGAERGAVMVRGAEVLRWRTGVAACMGARAPGLARPKVWSGRARAAGSTGTTRPRRSKCGERRVSNCSCFGS